MAREVAEQWREAFEKDERDRIDNEIIRSRQLFVDGVDRAGGTVGKWLSPMEAELALTAEAMRTGLVARVEAEDHEPSLLYLYRMQVAANEKAEVLVHAVGPCALCGRRAPLVPPFALQEGARYPPEQETKATLGLALAAGEAIAGHRCGVTVGPPNDVDGAGLYL